MGGGGKGGSTQKTEQTNKPPEWAQPLFEQSAKDAQNLYNSGSGFNVYQGSSIAPQSQQTQDALANIGNTSGTGVSTAGQADLTSMANGDWATEGNPYWRSALDSGLSDAAAKVNSLASGQGRYGSGANQKLLATTTGNMLTNALNTNYNTERQNQLQATSILDNRANTSLQNEMAVNQAQLGAGQTIDKQKQLELADEIARWTATDNQDWTRLGALQSAAAGSAGNYGTQSGTQQMSVGAGSALTSGLGLLGSFATKSDRRLKTNIERVGSAGGFPLYAFDYVGKPGRFVGVMAQDVLLSRPDAVVMEADGFYAVRYGALGLKMEQIS